MTVASMLGFCDGVNNEIVLLFCGKAADREQEEGRTIIGLSMGWPLKIAV